MAYMLLWSAIERYAKFRYPGTYCIEERIRQLPTETCFDKLVRQHVVAGQASKVVDVGNLGRAVF